MKKSFKRALFYGLFLFAVTQAVIMIFPHLFVKLAAPGSLLDKQAELLFSVLGFLYWLCIPVSKLVGSTINNLFMMSQSAQLDGLRLPLLRFLDLLFWVGFSLVVLKLTQKNAGQPTTTQKD